VTYIKDVGLKLYFLKIFWWYTSSFVGFYSAVEMKCIHAHCLRLVSVIFCLAGFKGTCTRSRFTGNNICTRRRKWYAKISFFSSFLFYVFTNHTRQQQINKNEHNNYTNNQTRTEKHGQKSNINHHPPYWTYYNNCIYIILTTILFAIHLKEAYIQHAPDTGSQTHWQNQCLKEKGYTELLNRKPPSISVKTNKS